MVAHRYREVEVQSKSQQRDSGAPGWISKCDGKRDEGQHDRGLHKPAQVAIYGVIDARRGGVIAGGCNFRRELALEGAGLKLRMHGYREQPWIEINLKQSVGD